MGSTAVLQLAGARLNVSTSAAVTVNGLACAVTSRTATTLACTLASAPTASISQSSFIYLAMDGYAAYTSVRQRSI